jgi:hypothetical protein
MAAPPSFSPPLEAGQRSSMPSSGGAALPGAPVVVAAPVPAAQYVVVNPPNAANVTVANDTSGRVSEYSGRAGVPIRTKWRQWLLAWRFHDVRLALSNAVDASSRVLWHRRVVERCRSIAPFLSFVNSDPFPVLTDSGRIVWMLDIYSTSDRYPYAEPVDATTGWNYLRGTVKATVDAYDGTVRFYIVDASDPMMRCYARAFPELFQPLSAMPEDLRRHARYPAAALQAQSRIWARLRQLKSDRPLREVTTFPDYATLSKVALPPGTSTEYSTRVQNARSTRTEPAMTEPEIFATTFLVTAHEAERPGTVVELDLARHVTSALLADGRYDGPHGDMPLSQRLWLWTPPSAKAQRITASPIGKRSAAPNARLQQSTSNDESVRRTYAGAVPLGDALLGVQSTWEYSGRRSAQLAEVVFQWNGHAMRAASFDAALRQLRATALLATMSQPVATANKRQSAPQPGEVLERARAQYDAMQRARRVNNWPAYGAAEKKLGELLGSPSEN